MSVYDRLKALGLTLPTPPKPVAAYIPAVRSGNLIFVSGQIPFAEGKLVRTGPVPSVVSLEQAREAARQCALNGLAIVEDQLGGPGSGRASGRAGADDGGNSGSRSGGGDKGGGLNHVRRIVRLGVFVQSDPGFADQPKVANGASELLLELFGERGRHARAAVGSIGLPLNATVEVEMIVEVEGG